MGWRVDSIWRTICVVAVALAWFSACKKGPPSFADVESGRIAMVDSQVEAIGQLLSRAGVAPEDFRVVERPRSLHEGENGVEVQRGQAVVLVLRGTTLDTMQPIGRLQALERLDLSRNALSRVEGLDFSGFLRQLHLDDNRLVALGSLGGLYGLQTLSVARNRLETLDGIEAVTSLQSLDASHNRVADPGPLIGLENLRAADLSHNRLDEAPEYLEHIPRLNVQGNPIPGR